MPVYNFTLNNKKVSVDADADMPLLWALRDQLQLVGTKYGCGIGQCGACTVHLEGNAIRSCQLKVDQLEGSNITTIEGLAENETHPVLQAWKEIDVPQCGYCQAGQIMTASAFLSKNPSPNQEEIRSAMHGNICRCASYNRIEKAVALAASKQS